MNPDPGRNENDDGVDYTGDTPRDDANDDPPLFHGTLPYESHVDTLFGTCLLDGNHCNWVGWNDYYLEYYNDVSL